MRFSYKPKAGDFIIAAVCLLFAAAVAFFFFGGESEAARAVLFIDGKEVQRFSLAGNGSAETVAEGACGPVTIRTEAGRICISHSLCPDQICVHTGWLSRPGQSAACVPGRILLVLEGYDLNGPDAVSQ